jgi:hypothetical protein
VNVVAILQSRAVAFSTRHRLQDQSVADCVRHCAVHRRRDTLGSDRQRARPGSLTLLLNQRLGPSTRLVGDERLSYAGFLASGAWERGYAEDGESHAKYSPPGIINEP